MHCIFCKRSTESSKSKEHILPESLGNYNTVLQRGIVCDKCNNYFSIKIERPLLESPYFKFLRFSHRLPNKRGAIPYSTLFSSAGVNVDMQIEQDDNLSICATKETCEGILIKHILNNSSLTLYQPIPNGPDPLLLSRLLAKMGLEYLALRISHIPGWEDDVIYHIALDDIRNHARLGGPSVWSFTGRDLYSSKNNFPDGSCNVEILNEMTLLYTDECNLIFIACILGIEYGIDLSNRYPAPYLDWLSQNRFESPLYPGNPSFACNQIKIM